MERAGCLSEIAESFGGFLDCAGRVEAEDNDAGGWGRGWGMWKCLSGPTLRPLPPPTFAAPKADPIFSTHHTSHFYTLAVECPSARLTSLFCFSPGFHYRFEGRRQYRHAPEFTLRPTAQCATPTQPCGNLCQIRRRQQQMARKNQK